MAVVIAYDGSEAAGAAVRAAGSLFAGAEGVVLTGREPAELLELPAAPVDVPDAAFATLDRISAEEADAAAAEGTRIAVEAGLRASARVITGAGNPWREILEAAEDADLLVCGARGRGAFGRPAL